MITELTKTSADLLFSSEMLVFPTPREITRPLGSNCFWRDGKSTKPFPQHSDVCIIQFAAARFLLLNFHTLLTARNTVQEKT